MIERAERSARRREITGYITLIMIVASVLFGTAWASGKRQADLLQIACGNARGHHDLTISVLQSSRLTERVGRELGLPIEPITIVVPEVPPECDGY